MTESRLCWSIPEYHMGVPSWGGGSRSWSVAETVPLEGTSWKHHALEAVGRSQVGENCVASPASLFVCGSAALRQRAPRPQLKRDPLGRAADTLENCERFSDWRAVWIDRDGRISAVQSWCPSFRRLHLDHLRPYGRRRWPAGRRRRSNVAPRHRQSQGADTYCAGSCPPIASSCVLLSPRLTRYAGVSRWR